MRADGEIGNNFLLVKSRAWVIKELSVCPNTHKDQLCLQPQINDYCQHYASNLRCQILTDLARHLQYNKLLTFSLESHRATLLPVEHNNDDGQYDDDNAKHSNDCYNGIEGC